MSTDAGERELRTYGRLVGFLYLTNMALYVAGDRLTAGFHLRDGFVRAAANIQASELAYRTGLGLLLAGAVANILLAGAMYVLLKPVSRNLALFALLWRTAEAALFGMCAVCAFSALALYTAQSPAFPLPEEEALAMLLSSGRQVAFLVATIYFSVGSALFFYLLFKSRYLPRALSTLGMAASVLALGYAFGLLIVPQLMAPLGIAGWIPIFLAEVLTGLWLVISGINPRHAASLRVGDDPSPPATTIPATS